MARSPLDFTGGIPPAASDGRLDAPAFHRNVRPIQALLAEFLNGRSGDALELGSGTGQHAVEFARRSPAITWWPSDVEDGHLRSIAAWRARAGLPNLRPPVRLDLLEPQRAWPALGLPDEFLVIFAANLVHITPWAATLGLFALAGRHLAADGRLFIYGAFMRDGRHTAPSNAAFDAGLRRFDPQWGLRDVGDLRAAAANEKLRLAATAEMPANNLMLVFERDA
jgi:SAM-dependent methyltransferase